MANAEAEEMDDVKELMTAISEVKVSLAEIKTEIKQITAIKATAEQARDTALEANNRSLQNEKDIAEIKDNDRKKWYAITGVISAFVLQLLYYFMLSNGH